MKIIISFIMLISFLNADNLSLKLESLINKDEQDKKDYKIYNIGDELKKNGFFMDNELYLISLTSLTPPYDKLIAKNKKEEALIKKYEKDLKSGKEKQNKHFIMLIKNKNFIALIDTGFANTQDNLISALKELNTKPSDISHLLLTHAHKDHLGGILKDKKNIFSNAKLIIDEKEYEWLKSSNDEFIKDSIKDFKTEFLKDEDSFLKGKSIQISSQKTYGHTPGHRIFVLNDKDLKLFFVADLLHTSLQIKNPDISIQYDYDKDLARKTRKEFIEQIKKEKAKVLIFSSHSTGLITF